MNETQTKQRSAQLEKWAIFLDEKFFQQGKFISVCSKTQFNPIR